MKIIFVPVENKENNTFMSLPVEIQSCCTDMMIWFFRYTVDINFRDAILIKKGLEGNNVTEYYKFCQFCGERHSTEKRITAAEVKQK